jgi:hypothetical protein
MHHMCVCVCVTSKPASIVGLCMLWVPWCCLRTALLLNGQLSLPQGCATCDPRCTGLLHILQPC